MPAIIDFHSDYFFEKMILKTCKFELFRYTIKSVLLLRKYVNKGCVLLNPNILMVLLSITLNELPYSQLYCTINQK